MLVAGLLRHQGEDRGSAHGPQKLEGGESGGFSGKLKEEKSGGSESEKEGESILFDAVLATVVSDGYELEVSDIEERSDELGMW